MSIAVVCTAETGTGVTLMVLKGITWDKTVFLTCLICDSQFLMTDLLRIGSSH